MYAAIMVSLPWKITEGNSPLIATAIHAGHDLRPGIARRMRLSSNERLREEDPYTDSFTCVAPTRVVVYRSRFEVDLNRPPEKAVYVQPEDAWGLKVWKFTLPTDEIEESLDLHRQFYREMKSLLQQQIDRFGQVVVLDIHSYNHRREGNSSPAAEEGANPTVNIGTGSMPAYRWDTLLQPFLAAFRAVDYQGQALDVRENVRFQGGYLPQWVHATFPEQACAIAIEFKKTFMDEWTGKFDRSALAQLGHALTVATHCLEQALLHQLPRLPSSIAEQGTIEFERRSVR
jgi:N-formylglutamate amidohydrolase